MTTQRTQPRRNGNASTIAPPVVTTTGTTSVPTIEPSVADVTVTANSALTEANKKLTVQQAGTTIGTAETIRTVNFASGAIVTAVGGDKVDVAIASGGSGTSAFTSISTNTTLASNTNYFAAVTGLTGTLPSSPSVGDFVGLATGNYNFIVAHGNGSQTILNLSTLSTAGTGNGIYLKPYSSIQIIYIGGNLWITQYRARTVNNWNGTPILESTANQKSYTPTLYNSPSIQYGVLSGINNGVTVGGSYGTDDLLCNSSPVQIIVTFPFPTLITAFDLYVGQQNTSYGGTAGYLVTSLDVYSGNTLGTLLQSYSPQNTSYNGVKQTFSMTNTTPYTQYVFSFISTSSSVGINELDTFGKILIGGEVVAT